MSSEKKFKIATLGCRTNQYESQAYQDQLKAMGFVAANDGEQADICIVNTCTVTESADGHSRHAIRQLARENPGSKLVVTGCWAERQPDAVKAIDGVTNVVSNKEKENLIATLFPEEDVPEFSIKNFDAHTRAFVKVQDGCNSYCTYCIIPYVRGRSRSRTINEVIAEVENLVANGYQEIVLTGINIGDFDGNPAEGQPANRLADLVRAVDNVKGVTRLRVSSIDPDEIDEDLTDAILNGKNTCPSMHIVLQSGSNVILKRMNRKYTRQIFLDSVEKLKNRCPEFTVTTDIIVGFPGETDVDFQDTLAVMRDIKFAKVHMFPYSDRARTRAAIMPNKVPHDVIKERKQILLREAEKLSYELRHSYINKQLTVLTESEDKDLGLITGHSSNFLPIIVKDKNIQSNQLVKVEIIENTAKGLVGIPL